MRYEIRQLEVGGVLDQAINLTKDHFALFFKIALVLFICSACLQLLALSITPEQTMIPAANPADFPRPQMPPLGPLFLMGLLGLVLTIVVRPLTSGAVTYAVASTYLEMPISVGIAFRRAWRVFLPLLLTGILAGLLILVSFLILFLRYMLVTQVVVIEGLSGGDALKRSRALMKGNWWNGFVLLVLLVAISMGISFIQPLIPLKALAVIVGNALQAAVFIFGTAASVVFYFSCRCKLENFDLVMLANAVGADDPRPKV